MKSCLLLFFLLLGCASAKMDVPEWLQQKLLQAERKPGTYEEVWIYQYQGSKVYYFLPPCCDKFTELYDRNGKLLCKPGGGITGKGDGACRDFYRKRKDGQLFWRVPRLID
ncbi:MAG: DUF6970 domain-containing protein [Bacteroidia bacterium]